MSSLKINKSTNFIEYTSDEVTWFADIYFNVQEREILLIGTTRNLTDNEREDIITEILSKYAFGNYINKETDIWKCKLKNRAKEKYEERQKNKMSYSLIGEKILEYNVNHNDPSIVILLKNVYTNLKIELLDMLERKKHMSTLEFNFSGAKYEYKLCLRILDYILKEMENELSLYVDKNVTLNFVKGKYNFNEKNAKILFVIKEA